MSTQQPDNANVPDWSSEEIINGNTEVYEAFYVYSVLGCQEVMWDSEDKDTDTRVVRKLLQKYWDYFSGNIVGEDVYLTYRIPNPKIGIQHSMKLGKPVATVTAEVPLNLPCTCVPLASLERLLTAFSDL